MSTIRTTVALIGTFPLLDTIRSIRCNYYNLLGLSVDLVVLVEVELVTSVMAVVVGNTGGNGSSDFVFCGGGGGSFNIDPNGTKSLGWFEDGKCEIKFIETQFNLY